MQYNGHILRHEQKYLISYHDSCALTHTLDSVMKRDKNCVDGGYFIRSLYFDDVFSGAYREKDAGIRRRRKHRLRIYNMSDKTINYEVKEKFDSYISKVSSKVDRKLADKLIEGNFDDMLCPGNQALMLGFIDSRTKLLRPKVIVDYYREVFVCDEGNVRITFDSRIRAGISSYDIFDSNVPTVPAIEPDRLVLEVKYDDYLPVHIREVLRQLSRWQTTQSKYIMCVDAKNTYYKKDVPYGSF